MNIEIVGFAAGGLVALALVPQVIKSWMTKSTKDISLVWNLILFCGLVLWIIYGFSIHNRPLMVFSVIETSLTASLLILKLIYK